MNNIFPTIKQTILPTLVQQRRIVGSVPSGTAAPFIALTSAPTQGNLIIIIAFAVQQRTVTTPSGFTLLNGYNEADGTTYIFWKLAGGAEPTPPAGYQVTYSTGGTNYSVHIYEFENINSSYPIQYLGGGNGTGLNHTVDASSVDAKANKNNVLFATFNGDNTVSGVSFDNSFINELPTSGNTYSSTAMRFYSSVTTAQNTAITIIGTAATNTHLFRIRGKIGVFFTVNAGPDQSIDSGDTVQLAGNRDGLWTTSGTGTFDDDTISNAVYTPSSDDITLGFVTLTLTSGGFSDDMTVSIGAGNILALVDRYWDSDDATDTAGALTGWVDRKASAAMTIIGAPTVTTGGLDSHKEVRLDGVDDALRHATVQYKSLLVVCMFNESGSGSRISHIPSSNASTNYHAGLFISTTVGIGMSGDNVRLTFDKTDPEIDTDDADSAYYCYSVGDIYDFRRNGLRAYQSTETATTDTTTTATNSFIGCVGNGAGGATGQFAKLRILCVMMKATTAWTVDERLIIDRYIAARYPSLGMAGEKIIPLDATANASNPLVTGHSDGGGAGNFYPAAHTRISGVDRIIAKSVDNTGNMIKSTDDLETWSEVAGPIITNSGSAVIDGTYTYRNGVWRYDGTTHYLWYNPRNNSGIEFVCLRTCTGDPETPANWSAPTSKLTPAQVNSALGTSYDDLGGFFPFFNEEEGQWYAVVDASDAVGNDIILCTMTAIDGGTITPVSKLLERNLPYWTTISTGGVIKLSSGKWAMICMSGRAVGTSKGERDGWLYIADSITGPWTRSYRPIISSRPNTGSAWDQRWAHAHRTSIIENDGKWVTPQLVNGLIYDIHAGASWPVEVSLMGWHSIDPALYELATI